MSDSIYRENTDRRIAAIYTAAYEIFDLKKHDWNYLRSHMHPAQVREFYEFLYALWPEPMNVSDFMPKPNPNKLRALYIGSETPRTIASKISRYCLYTDEILVTLPFLNPRIVTDDFSPILHPEKHMSVTLHDLAFLFQIGPWVKRGQVLLIPEPIQHNRSLWQYVVDNAECMAGSDEHERDMKQLFDEGFGEDMFNADLVGYQLRIPKRFRKDWIKHNFPRYDEKSVAAMERVMDRMRKQDPYILDQDADLEGEYQIHKAGSTVEVGELICHMTGSYMYTDNSYQWKRILATADGEPAGSSWSPLTQAFQQLDFKFLNDVQPEYASRLAVDGRMAGFRQFLREMWVEIKEIKDPILQHHCAIELSDRLTHEYSVARADWRKIDRDLIKWTGVSGVGSLLTGAMHPVMPIVGFSIAAVTQLVNSTMQRKDYIHSVPMAVFLELNQYDKHLRKG